MANDISTTTSWNDLYSKIDHAAAEFDQHNRQFRNGESSAYKEELQGLKKILQEHLEPKLKDTPVKFYFQCTPEPYGGSQLNAEIGGLIDMEVFCQFYHTFSNGNNVRQYTGQNLYDTSKKIDAITFKKP